MNSEIDKTLIEETLSRLDVPHLVGQLLAPRAASHYLPADTAAYHRLLRLVREMHVGGFVLFQGEVLGQAQLVGELQSVAEIPLLFGQDAEWGVGMRLGDATSFPSMAALAATGDRRHARELGRVTAAEARALGVHHVYAPVVDVNNNRDNPIINVRSFGENTSDVAAMGEQVILGLQEGGVLSTAKHFPGHGDTAVDSHSGLPRLGLGIDRLETTEWPPFRAAIRAGVDSIMVGHLAMTALDGPDAPPASLSRNIVTGLLRERLGFEGLIVSDALDMNGIQLHYEPGEAAVRSVEAGIDILLTSPDDDAAYRALLRAVESGRLNQDALVASVRRILEAKARVGLLGAPRSARPSLSEVRNVVGCRKHRDAARDAARQAVTVIKDDDLLPVADGARILVVELHDTEYPETSLDPFFDEVVRGSGGNNASATATRLRIGRTCYPEQLAAVDAAAADSDIVIAAAVVAVRSFSGLIGLPERHADVLRVAAAHAPVAVVSFGSPYIIDNVLGDAGCVLLGYGHAPVIQRACAEVLRGQVTASGRLPLTISDELPIGFGL